MAAAREGESYYTTLEIDPAVGEAEVHRAYRRLKELYATDSPAVYGAYTERELVLLHRNFQQAFTVLADPEKRRLYDEGLRAEETGDAPPPRLREVIVAAAPPPENEEDVANPALAVALATADAEYTGELLKKIRVARGVTIEEMEERTKIARSHLRDLEAEKWVNLPASLYVRGFLSNIARELKIPAQRLLDTYYVRVKAHYKEKKRD